MSWFWLAADWVFGNYPLAPAGFLWLLLVVGQFWIGPPLSLRISAKFRAFALKHLQASDGDGDYVGERQWIGGVRWEYYGGGFHRALSILNTTKAEREYLVPISNFLYPAFAIIACLAATFILADLPDHPGPEAVRQVASSGVITFVLTGIVVLYNVLFQCGAQWIMYPKVLDPERLSTGRSELHRQKAYGDARNNTEEEARASLTGRTIRKSKVYDQEY